MRAFREAWGSDPTHRSVGPALLLLFGAFIVAMLLAVNLTSYAILLYPDLPKRLGGGKKPHALVMMSEAYPEHSGLPLSKDGRVIGPVAFYSKRVPQWRSLVVTSRDLSSKAFVTTSAPCRSRGSIFQVSCT